MESEQAAQLLNEAIALNDTGDLAGALAILTTIVEAPIPFDMLRLTDDEQTPLVLDVYRFMGKIHWKLGRLPEAISCFRYARRHYPKDESVSLGLFYTLCKNGQSDEALNEMERFLAIAPSAKYESFRGQFYFDEAMRSEDEEKRVALLEKAIQAEPEYAEAFMELGISYKRLGEIEKAEVALRKSIALDDDGLAHLFLGNLFFSLEEWDAAEKEFMEAQTRLPDVATPLWCQADVYRKKGDLGTSERLYRAAVAIEPDSADALARLGRALLENNKGDEGAIYIEMALKEDPACNVALKWKKQFNVMLERDNG